jgi:hypothetical protein
MSRIVKSRQIPPICCRNYAKNQLKYQYLWHALDPKLWEDVEFPIQIRRDLDTRK